MKKNNSLEELLKDVKIHYFLEVPFFESLFSLTSGLLLGYFSDTISEEIRSILEYSPMFLYGFSGYNNRVIVKKEKEKVFSDDNEEEVLIESKNTFLEKILGTSLGIVYASTLELLGYSIGIIAKNYLK